MQYGDTRPPQFKVILLGESGVGKTSMFQRFRSRDIPSSPKSALMLDCYQHSRQFAVGPNSHAVQLDLWDTANMERARSLTESYYRETTAFLLVYDIADAMSLKHIQTYWQQELQYHKSDSTTGISFLIGNKSDLEVTRYDSEHTTVSYANKVIGKHCTGVFEVSAKEDYCVEKMFHAVAEYIWKYQTQKNTKHNISANTSGSVLRGDGKENDSTIRLDRNTTENEIKTTGKGWRCC